MLLFTGLMFTAIATTFGQADTTKSATQTPQSSQTPSSQTQIPGNQADQNYAKDMSKIKASEIPANLKTTLQGSDYKGWENANIYKSKTGDAYVVEIMTDGKPKAHRFDATGKAVKDQ